MATHACILRKSDNAVLVRADAGQVLQLGESVYFHPECIDHTRFEVSDRIYTCPEKGTCFWVDLKTDKGFLNDVAWVYPETKQGFEHIAGWYGFYAHHRYYYYAECD